MNITLHVEPQTAPVSWGTFLLTKPPYSIALDGYVGAGPRFARGPGGPRANFNHHEGVDRLATRSTCAQVLMAIRQGLMATFRDADGPRVHVFVNDCDEDVCTAWFLLKHHYLAAGTMNPAINRLVALEDALDTTGGAYPFPVDLPALRELAWVYQPYREARQIGDLGRLPAASQQSIITSVEHRIMRHVAGSGEAAPSLDAAYRTVQRGKGWAMVAEIGPYARTAMFADGIHAFVAYGDVDQDRPTKRVTVGRMSPYVPFDVPAILTALNHAEFGEDVPQARWGGGDTIGGSPRGVGTRLTLDRIAAVVEGVCALGAPR